MAESPDNLSQLEAAREAMGLRGVVDSSGTFRALEAAEVRAEEVEQAPRLYEVGQAVIDLRDQFEEVA